MIAIATTTWNCRDIIEEFLEHHLAGADTKIFVVEYGSTDGTADILQRYADTGSVEVFRLPGLADKDPSNLLLDRIHRHHGQVEWSFFIDPDEFISDARALRDELARLAGEVKAVNLPRFNVTGRRTDVSHTPRPFVDLNLKINTRKRRTVEERRSVHLDPPWIFTDIPGKIGLRMPSDLPVGPGDHSAGGRAGHALDSVALLHFPIRSWAQFEEKIRLAELDFEANPNLGPGFGWHWRRWITLKKRGDLVSEYLCQFISDEDIASLLRDNAIEIIGSAETAVPSRR